MQVIKNVFNGWCVFCKLYKWFGLLFVQYVKFSQFIFDNFIFYIQMGQCVFIYYELFVSLVVCLQCYDVVSFILNESILRGKRFIFFIEVFFCQCVGVICVQCQFCFNVIVISIRQSVLIDVSLIQVVLSIVCCINVCC